MAKIIHILGVRRYSSATRLCGAWYPSSLTSDSLICWANGECFVVMRPPVGTKQSSTAESFHTLAVCTPGRTATT
eukprot:760729-Prymnesium_polylepis.1